MTTGLTEKDVEAILERFQQRAKDREEVERLRREKEAEEQERRWQKQLSGLEQNLEQRIGERIEEIERRMEQRLSSLATKEEVGAIRSRVEKFPEKPELPENFEERVRKALQEGLKGEELRNALCEGLSPALCDRVVKEVEKKFPEPAHRSAKEYFDCPECRPPLVREATKREEVRKGVIDTLTDDELTGILERLKKKREEERRSRF